MSWSVNWPTNLDPAVIAGLSGLVPYGLAAVGLPLTAGSVMSAFGPAARSSPASRIPPGAPTASSAARTVSLASANGGRPGNIRPKKTLLAGAPGGSMSPDRAPAATGAAAAGPARSPADAAASPAPIAPAPASSPRRVNPARSEVSLIALALL
jgi:hypothetical protein